MEVRYKTTFVRQYKKLSKALQEEVKERIELFKESPSHHFLKTHKLHGRMKGSWSFSVNYQYRIVFEYRENKDVDLLLVGDHSMYS